MSHTCHWPGCQAEVPPRFWGCLKHWRKLPGHLRARILNAYRPGQEIDKRPSVEYVEAAKAVQQWIATDQAPRSRLAGRRTPL